MLSVEQGAKSARGMVGKTIKSTKSVATKFQPPTHPALIITSAFTSPHINQLKKALEENYIAYGMQNSKKKVNRPPGFPADKNFVIVDDLLGPSILEGEFLGLKICRVDYPRANNTKDVIKKFDKYIGLGKQTVQQKSRIQQIEGSQWQHDQNNLKMVGAANVKGKIPFNQKSNALHGMNRINGINGVNEGNGFNVLGKELELGDIEKVFQIKQQVQNFRDVFKRSKKKSSSSRSSESSKAKKSKNKKQKKDKKSKSKAQKIQKSQKNNIKLKSVNKINQKGPNKQLQKRSLFMLLTNKQSDNYEKQVKKLGSGQNKRMIPVKSLSQYYKLCYETGQGENCLLLSPNVAFNQLHKFRNLKDVYIYGDDPQFCSQLVKGNIKKAALDPQSLQKILDSQGFNRNDPKQYVKPKRWVQSGNPKPLNELEAKNGKKQVESDQDNNKHSLFSRFMNFFKGKKKQKKKGLSVSSESSINQKNPKISKRNKSSSKNTSSLSISKSSSSSKKGKSDKIKQLKQKQNENEKEKEKEKEINEQNLNKVNKEVSKSNKILEPVSLGRLVNQNQKLQGIKIQPENEKLSKAPSRKIIKIKTKVSGKQNQNILNEKPKLEEQPYNLKLNSKSPSGALQIQSKNNSQKQVKQIAFLGRAGKKQPSVIISPPTKKSDKQFRKSSLTKKLQFQPINFLLQKNKKSSSSSSSSSSSNKKYQKKPNKDNNKKSKKQKQKQNQMMSFQNPKQQINDDQLIYNRNNKQIDQDYYQAKKNTKKKVIIQKENKIYRKNNSPEPAFHIQRPSDDQTQLKSKNLPIPQFQTPKIKKSLHNPVAPQQYQGLFNPDQDFNSNLQAIPSIHNKKNQNEKVLLNKTINAPANQSIPRTLPQNLINQEIPLVTSNIYRTGPTQAPSNLTQNYQKPMEIRNIRSISAGPINFNLPFDQTKYDRTVQNGVTVYRPKGFSLYNNIPVSPRPFRNTPTMYFNPNVPPLYQGDKSTSQTRPPFFTGFPLKQTISTQQSQTNTYMIPKPQLAKNPLFSTFDYFNNNNSLPVYSQNQTNLKNKKQNKDKPIQPQDQPQNTCHRCKSSRITHQNPKKTKNKKDNKQNQLPIHNEYCTRPSNKLTKTRQLFDSFDSDSSSKCKRKNAFSFDKYNKNKDPLSSILDQNSHLRGQNNDKNYSVLYVVHSKLPPQLIKQLFQISDSSDTIQTFSKYQKMQQIIQKAENVFDFVLVFYPNFDHQPNNLIRQNKNLYYVTYNSKDIQNLIQKNLIKISRTRDLNDILQGLYQNKPIKRCNVDEVEKIGYIYFKDFNKNIRNMTKIVKRYYPNAQTRKYFSVMDLPTKLPSIKNQLTLILIDQISFNQITKYCQQQQVLNRNLIKICIPKSSQAMKLCKNQPGLEKMIWLTERQLDDPDFIVRRLLKRNR